MNGSYVPHWLILRRTRVVIPQLFSTSWVSPTLVIVLTLYRFLKSWLCKQLFSFSLYAFNPFLDVLMQLLSPHMHLIRSAIGRLVQITVRCDGSLQRIKVRLAKHMSTQQVSQHLWIYSVAKRFGILNVETPFLTRMDGIIVWLTRLGYQLYCALVISCMSRP